MITIKNLVIEYDQKTIINNLSKSLKASSLTLVKGKNGTGKSTLLKCLSSEINISSRSISIRDLSPEEYWKKYRTSASIINDTPFVYGYLTGLEMIKAVISFKEEKPRQYKKRINELVDLFHVALFSSITCNQMSLGTKKKFYLIGMLVTKPELVIADEPFSGLDHDSCTVLCNVLKELTKTGSTCIVSSHGASGIIYDDFDQVIEMS